MPSRLHRLIRIIRIVRRKGFPGVQDLCFALKVKERTLFNDLKELKDELGVHVQFDKVRRGYWIEKDDLELTFFSLSADTALHLLVAIELLEVYSGAESAECLRKLFAYELRACLGDDKLTLARSEIRAKLGAKGITRTNF